MERKQLVSAVNEALAQYSQGKVPSVSRYKQRISKGGKASNAYAATMKAVKSQYKEEAKAGAEAYESTGYQWAQRDNALNETRKAEAFAFAGAGPEVLELVKAGVKRFYKEMKAKLAEAGPISGDKATQHVGARKQLAIIDSRQYEKLAILDGFGALYEMARGGDEWERDASAACFEQLSTLGWNALVSACATLRSVSKGNGLTRAEAVKIANGKRTVRKQEKKVKPVSTAALINQAREIAIALAQRGDVKGIDVRMMLKALGEQHAAGEAEAKRTAPAKAQADSLRARIKARLSEKAAQAEQGVMAKALKKAA